VPQYRLNASHLLLLSFVTLVGIYNILSKGAALSRLFASTCYIVLEIDINIESVAHFTGTMVETDGEDYPTYVRYGPDNRKVVMGESEETLYDCEDIEKLYQEFINKSSKEKYLCQVRTV